MSGNAKEGTAARPAQDRRLLVGGLLLIAGLLVELFTFSWAGPLSFVLMLVLGGGLIVCGMACTAWALLRPGD